MTGRQPAPQVKPLPGGGWVVNCVPDTVEQYYHWAIKVVFRGDDRWAVKHFGEVLSTRGCWDIEPRPSERTDAWLSTHRFSSDEALRLARRHAPRIRVNGLTAADVIARSNRPT